MNRINGKFDQLRLTGKKAFIAFITAGYPDLETTIALASEFENSGVDILELGVPFSDPLADGPVIQASSCEALRNGVTLKKILDSVYAIRKATNIPVALMTYYNPVYRFGEEKFMQEAFSAGVDGLIVPDLPVEEAGSFIAAARSRGLATVFFLSPTTEKVRMPGIFQASSGFVYFVSVDGITGGQTSVPEEIASKLKLASSLSSCPICIGFGISTPEQVRSFSRLADGVIVGSAIVREITKYAGRPDMVKRVSAFVKELSSSCG